MKVHGYKVRYIDEGELQEDRYPDLNGMEEMCSDYLVIDIVPDYSELPMAPVYED